MRPRHADLFATDLDEQTLIRYIDRLLMFYVRTGDRLQRTSVWMENMEGGLDYLRSVIIEDRLGIGAELEAMMSDIVGTWQCEWKSTLADPDKLKLFELHPTDLRALAGNVAQLEAGRQVAVLHEDGFEGIKKFLPPPARRALVLCDPSYEIKSDYAKVLDMAADSLKRFATGTYAFWYPIIPRPEAHDLPRRLKTLATKAGKSWLHATLTVKNSKPVENAAGDLKRPGLPASGMFLINPPYTLKAALKDALPQMVELLAQDRHAAHTLESGG